MAAMKKCNIVPDIMMEDNYWSLNNLNKYKESFIRVQAFTSAPCDPAPLQVQSQTFPPPECYHGHSKT